MLEIKWHPKSDKISQIPKEGIEFAWISEDYQQLHQLVWCKDFLQDVIFGHLNSRETEIYKFNYNPVVDPKPYMQKTRMIISNWKDHSFGQKVEENLVPFLNAIEKRLKMQKTTFQKCDKVPPTYKKSGIYLLEGDPRWMIAPPMISMFSLLIRVGMLHQVDETFGSTLRKLRDGKIAPYYPTISLNNKGVNTIDTDRSLLQVTYKSIQRILKEGDRKIFGSDINKNYPKFGKNGESTSVYFIHESCGLKAFAKELTKSQFPQWHEPEVKAEVLP